MAGGGDISGCVELTAAYVNFNRFQSGLYGISFDLTGNATVTGERIWGKDPTVDVTNAVCQLYYLSLSCTSGSVQFFDGSDGSHLPGLKVSDVTAMNGKTQVWDFGKDPLLCLTADSTQSLCISCENGWVSGFMKVGWGSKS